MRRRSRPKQGDGPGHNTNNFGAAVEQVWREAGSYYVLGYHAPINDHRLHEIEIKVNVKGVTVRARRGRG